MKIMITGGTGFVGNGLIQRLAKDDRISLSLALRRKPEFAPPSSSYAVVGDLLPTTDWRAALSGCEVVIHSAARVHVMNEESKSPLKEFRRVNVEGTLNLARQAAELGVRRFLFISSIKVNGEVTANDEIFGADDAPAPVDPYGISKYEAEQELLALAGSTGMEVVIIRPPLVYGPGVKGNFLSMMHYVHKCIPLPLGAIHNRRSMVALPNLVDLIVTCLHHPAAANQIFLAGDGEDLSTTELLTHLGRALGKPARLLPVPMKMLGLCSKMVGKQAVGQRLCGSLRVDIGKAQHLLGWQPPVSVIDALTETALAFLEDQKASKNVGLR